MIHVVILAAIAVFAYRLMWDYVDQQQRKRIREREERFEEFRRRRRAAFVQQSKDRITEVLAQTP